MCRVCVVLELLSQVLMVCTLEVIGKVMEALMQHAASQQQAVMSPVPGVADAGAGGAGAGYAPGAAPPGTGAFH